MISIIDILNKINLNESIQVIKHLEHHGEKLYTGNPHATIEHLKATANFLAGTPQVGHNLSYKVDGSVSIVFGKHGGRPFVKYKGEGSPHLYSQSEIDEATKEKPYLKQPFTVGLRAAQHPQIGKHTGYQADIALEASPTTFKGNLITYSKPSKNMKHAIAVHTQLNTETGHKTGSNPDVSFLNTKEAHFPPLSLNTKTFDISSDELEQLRHHISKADSILKDNRVMELMSDIASHVDPTNKTGHRHLVFKQFTNAVQRGEVQERSVESLKNWMQGKLEKAKGADKNRWQGHIQFLGNNPIALANLLKAHDHADAARDIIVDVLHRSNNLPMTPEGGHSQGEGFVSELPGFGQVKFIPRTFTSANVAQKEKFKKAAKEIKEEMATGSGAVAGIGVNTSTGNPDDSEVKVSKAAQYNYTQSNMGMQPLYGQTPKYQQQPRRRRLVMDMLSKMRMNVGRESY